MIPYRVHNYGIPFYLPSIFHLISFLCYNYFIVTYLPAFVMIFNSSSLLFPSRLASNKAAPSAQFCSFCSLIVFKHMWQNAFLRWADLPTLIYYTCYLLSCLCCYLLMMLFCLRLIFIPYHNFFLISLLFVPPTLLLLMQIKLNYWWLVVCNLPFSRVLHIPLDHFFLNVFLPLSIWVCNLTV